MFSLDSYFVSTPYEVAAKCPSIQAIKNKKLNHIQGGAQDHLYYPYRIDSYNTQNTYMFVIAEIKASSSEAALKIGNAVLSTLSEPVKTFIDDGRWVCEYKVVSPYRATTITPVDFN